MCMRWFIARTAKLPYAGWRELSDNLERFAPSDVEGVVSNILRAMRNTVLGSPRGVEVETLFSRNRLIPRMTSAINWWESKRLNIWRGARRKGQRAFANPDPMMQNLYWTLIASGARTDTAAQGVVRRAVPRPTAPRTVAAIRPRSRWSVPIVRQFLGSSFPPRSAKRSARESLAPLEASVNWPCFPVLPDAPHSIPAPLLVVPSP